MSLTFILGGTLLMQPCLVSGRRSAVQEVALAKANFTVESQHDNILWRCESVPTYTKGLTCHGQKAACFDDVKGSVWACLGDGQDLSRTCSATYAPDGERYLGTCLFKGHAKWGQALIFRKDLKHWMIPPKGSKLAPPPKNAQPHAAHPLTCSDKKNTDYPGHDINHISPVVSEGECCWLCDQDPNCFYWSWGKHSAPSAIREHCWLKSNHGEAKGHAHVHSGKSSKRSLSKQKPAASSGNKHEYTDKHVFRCETVPSFTPGRSCDTDNRIMSACFSTRRGTPWACLRPGANRGCQGSPDPRGKKYHGACVRKGHAKWASAKAFSGKSPQPAAKKKPAAKKEVPQHNAPANKAGLTTSWKGHGPMLGRQNWCKAQKPHHTWTASHCPKGPKLEINIMTYNLFWWSLYGVRHGAGGMASKLMGTTGPFDMIGFQECDDVKRVVREIPGDLYAYVAGDHAVSMAYLKAKWTLVSSGKQDVNQDQWGRRIVHWTRLKHKSTGKVVFFMNHHGPLGDAGYCGHESTAFLMLKQIGLHAKPEDEVIIVGDFNAVPHSMTVRHLEQHIPRIFSGRDFGGVDHFFSKCGKALEKKNWGKGGSDHDALSVKFLI